MYMSAIIQSDAIILHQSSNIISLKRYSFKVQLFTQKCAIVNTSFYSVKNKFSIFFFSKNSIKKYFLFYFMARYQWDIDTEITLMQMRVFTL